MRDVSDNTTAALVSPSSTDGVRCRQGSASSRTRISCFLPRRGIAALGAAFMNNLPLRKLGSFCVAVSVKRRPFPSVIAFPPVSSRLPRHPPPSLPGRLLSSLCRPVCSQLAGRRAFGSNHGGGSASSKGDDDVVSRSDVEARVLEVFRGFDKVKSEKVGR